MIRSTFNNIASNFDIPSAVKNIDQKLPPSSVTDLDSNSQLPLQNPLSAFASYSCIFTLGILTKDQVAYPSSYRSGDPFSLILRSGGTGNNQIRTEYERQLGITGEYFIEDFNADSIISPTSNTRLTNATNFEFTVKEPYSMGLFLQTLAVSAQQAGHANYAKAPYMLSIEFIGWDDDQNITEIPNTKRFYPMFFTGIEFNVTAGGSEYTIQAIPWNEQGFADEVQTIQEDYDLKGETLSELLQIGEDGRESLSFLLNKKEQSEEEGDSKKTGNRYVIQFPTEKATADENILGEPQQARGATASADQPLGRTRVEKNPVSLQSIQGFAENTANINEIGKSFITKKSWEGGFQPFGEEEFEETNPGIFKRGNITIKEKQRRIEFKKGTRIQEIIEELVLLSDYGRKLVEQQETDGMGMKNWFRIESAVYPVTDIETENQRGEPAKVFVYKVIPYKYNAITTSKPSAATPGVDQLKSNAVKKYDYIYTGENDDIIDFTLDFNTAFYQQIQFDLGQLTQSEQEGSASESIQQEKEQYHTVPTGQRNTNAVGVDEAVPSVSSHPGTPGGEVAGTTVYPETKIARAFNEAIVNGVDLITAQMEIWGDPYFIADSGQGNYTARTSTASPNITEDGTIDYQNGEVDIVLNFRTPVDIGDGGFMEFPTLQSEPVAQFSGVYKVITVRNSFSSNKFTQSLELVRRRNQVAEETENQSGVEETTQDKAIRPPGYFPHQRE